VAGNGECPAPPIVHSTTMKVAADRIAVSSPAANSTRRFGRNPNIIGDTLFRVLVSPPDQIELIVAAVFKPAVQEMIVQPGAPTALCCHADIDLKHHHRNACRQQGEVDQRHIKNGCGVATFERIEDRPSSKRSCRRKRRGKSRTVS